MRPFRFWQTPARLDPAQVPHTFGGSPEEVTQALAHLSLANRFFGGTRSLLGPLRRLMAAHPSGPIRLLDVGCGGADIPRAIVEWARRRGLQVWIVAVDQDADAVRRAAAALRAYPEVRVVRGDAFHLPFPPRSFHYVTSAMLLHYFSREDAITLLRSWVKLAPRALLINDIERHWFPCAVIPILRRTSGSSLFREGSRQTVLRGFTAGEIGRLGDQAGFRHVEVRRYFPFRLTLIGRVAP